MLLKLRNTVFVSILLLLLLSCNKKEEYACFKTKGIHLLDCKGNDFIIRGVNVHHAWDSMKSLAALTDIAALKVNCIRIVWESKLSVESLERAVERCVELEMIPMVELHDATGDSTHTKLIDMAIYFSTDEMKRLMKKYEPYLLINIANEWGNHHTTGEYWRDGYFKCIDVLRSSGYKSTIVVDAPGWGQNINPILDYGNDIIERDELHNILFSIHMYGSWNDENKISTELLKVQEKGIPIIVGEFGYNYNNGDNNLKCQVNQKQILKTCNDLGIGYVAWSWTGNNKENRWLDLVDRDLVDRQDWKTLTYWGEEIFKSQYGIENTAEKASVFVK